MQTQYQYTISKPTLPAAAILLGLMVITGLIGLGLAAYSAFAFIGRPVQAVAFALIIEAGMISEAMAIVRKNKLAIPGLLISLLVSGMYNYTQAARAGLQLTPALTDQVQLAALSIGPLSAVFFLALALGNELTIHEASVKSWEIERQKWQDSQTEREARRQERREARAERSRERMIEGANVPGTFPGTWENVPPVVPLAKGTYQEYKTFLQSNGANHTRAELARKFNVTERAITKWAARYREERQPVEIQSN